MGDAHRHVGETAMNARSSRSHTLFRMVIESRERAGASATAAGGGAAAAPGVLGSVVVDAVRVSTLNLVDLAGSERVSKVDGEEGGRGCYGRWLAGPPPRLRGAACLVARA